MLFALSTDDRTLMVFGDTADAAAYCEGLDVAEGGWRFWDATGAPLEAAFAEPAVRGRLLAANGRYALVPAHAPDATPLRACLDAIRALAPNPHVSDLAGLRLLLDERHRASTQGATNAGPGNTGERAP